MNCSPFVLHERLHAALLPFHYLFFSASICVIYKGFSSNCVHFAVVKVRMKKQMVGKITGSTRQHSQNTHTHTEYESERETAYGCDGNVQFNFPYLLKPLKSIKHKSKALHHFQEFILFTVIYLFYSCLHLLSHSTFE